MPFMFISLFGLFLLGSFHFEGNESEAIIDSRGHVFFPEED